VARRCSQSGTREALTGRPAPLILVVDDCFDIRALYSECLLDAGYRVASAADGNGALTLALSSFPDLALLDLQMPGLDGWETARLLKSYWATRQIPLVALSGLHDAETVTRALQAGCNRFAPKPCLPDELISVVRSVLAEEERKHRDVI
jgi:CheY-like chemotaxis protein